MIIFSERVNGMYRDVRKAINEKEKGIVKKLVKDQVAAGAGCEYIRGSSNWDNPAETALLRKCGFALVDLNGEEDEEPCYLAVRPVRNL